MTYSLLDRTVHRIAFGAPHLQMMLSEIEETAFARQFRDVPMGPPVFVTSLPRAGTTVLLEALEELPGMAAHHYGDMPFIYAPILWSAMNGSFRRAGEKRERAHGDGIAINAESPEAFEEIFWMRFWPEHYSDDVIKPWRNNSEKPEFNDFLITHMRKIVALRRPEGGRYLSKNNANIARLDYLVRFFPEARIIVPFRDPIDQARSLLRQHLNFCGQHAVSPFVRRYMRDIGHFEFGELHRPILFDGFAERAAGLTPVQLEYWLAYWISAFRHVRAHAHNILLVPLEEIRRQPAHHLRRICSSLSIETEICIDRAVEHFSMTAERKIPAATNALEREAVMLHEELLDLAGSSGNKIKEATLAQTG